MKIKINDSIEGITLGDLFFSVPRENAIKSAEKEVADICFLKLKELNCETDEMLKLLENELEFMTKTNTVYHFLLLKDIAELSDENHYPIIVDGNIHYSIIAYLLGIVSSNPIDYEVSMYPDCVWGNPGSLKKPDFSIRISQEIRLSIGRMLNDKYSYIESDEFMYYHINVVNSQIYEEIEKYMAIDCENKNLDNSICCRVLNFMADELIAKNDGITEEEYAAIKDFIVDLKRINHCNFNILVKIYAYIHGSFRGNKAVKDIYNNNFYTTRDEFFNILIKYGVQRDIALNIVKNGVWSQGQKRKEYEKKLLGYEVPQDVIDYFDKVNNLWTIGACTSRVKMMYKMFENKI